MITKELFSQSMNSIMIQMHNDRKNNELISEAFGGEFSIPHDSSLTIKCIIDLLSVYFDKDLINFYIFDMNFGKIGPESDYVSPEDYYEKLTNQIQ